MSSKTLTQESNTWLLYHPECHHEISIRSARILELKASLCSYGYICSIIPTIYTINYTCNILAIWYQMFVIIWSLYNSVCVLITYILTHTRVHTYTHTYIHTYIHTYKHVYIHYYIPHARIRKPQSRRDW